MDNKQEAIEKIENDVDKQNDASHEVSTFRTVLPQFLASSAKNILLFNLGLAVSFPTIVVPVLRGLQTHRNPNEILSFTDEQSSWYGSIAFLAQPIGSMLSGILTERLGRRRAMMLVNIPHIAAFLLLTYASSLAEVYVAALLLGLGVGFMEAPIITYVGEISQPSVRGVLLALANMSAQCGTFTVYLLGSLTLWRQAATICLVFPLLALLAIFFIPESPFWLVSRNRNGDALKSLQWLRGWVSPQVVDKEFVEISRYMDQMQKKCKDCEVTHQDRCEHSVSRWKLWKTMLLPSTLRPFILTMLTFITIQFNGLVAVRPYLVQIFQTYGFPLDPNWASVVLGSLDILSNTICMLTVRTVGKRWLFLTSIVGCSTFCFVLGFNAIAILPPGASSFDKTFINEEHEGDNRFALISFLFLAFFAGLGSGIPYMCLSEIFPFRTRGPATGITAACSYLFVFITTKTYLLFEQTLALSGTFLFYGFLGVIGFIVHYIIFPETEGRTLEEIELYFADTERSLNDRNIRRFSKTEKPSEAAEKIKQHARKFDAIDNSKFDKTR